MHPVYYVVLLALFVIALTGMWHAAFAPGRMTAKAGFQILALAILAAADAATLVVAPW